MVCLDKKIILGIDPGKNGAWALLDEDGGYLDSGRFDDRHRLDIANADFAILEKVSARPGQGVVSVFIFGANYGIWQGYLECSRTPFEVVTPQRWQKSVLDFVPAKTPKPQGESNKDAVRRLKRNRDIIKEAVVAFVARRYPELCEILSRKKNWDIADAVCLALYGLQKGLLK